MLDDRCAVRNNGGRFFPPSCQLILGPIWPHKQWVPRTLSPQYKLIRSQKLTVNLRLLSRLEMYGALSLLSLYVCLSLYLVTRKTWLADGENSQHGSHGILVTVGRSSETSNGYGSALCPLYPEVPMALYCIILFFYDKLPATNMQWDLKTAQPWSIFGSIGPTWREDRQTLGSKPARADERSSCQLFMHGILSRDSLRELRSERGNRTCRKSLGIWSCCHLKLITVRILSRGEIDWSNSHIVLTKSSATDVRELFPVNSP
jgi:hypothetical protein